MPKRTKDKATQPPPTKRQSTRSTAATSRSNYSNAATSETSQPAIETSTTPTDTSETTPTTTVVAAQHQSLQTQELVSQLSNVIQLLTTSLSGNAPINSTQPQGPLPNEDSAEVLSEVSDNPPTLLIRVSAPLHTGTTKPPFSATQNSPVSLPAVPSRLKDKIISGEFIDFTSLLSRAMFSGTQSVEPSKFITFYLNPEKDDFSVRPTPPPRKISSFLTWMEVWNIYLAILIEHAPARAPQLVAYRIITSASN